LKVVPVKQNSMNIQLVVPTRGCVNNCPFCCSKMHTCPYENRFNEVEIIKRLNYAKLHNIDTCVLTGTGEVLQNKPFLVNLSTIFNKIDKINHVFPNMELQTTGVMLNDKENRQILQSLLRVNTISLSVSDIFSDENNMNIIKVSEKLQFRLDELIKTLKGDGFNVRLSINMLNILDGIKPEFIFKCAKLLGADQISFKKMYYNNEFGYEQNEWIRNNMCSEETYNDIKAFILSKGRDQYTLEFGSKVYSVYGMSTVIIDDCMAVNNSDTLRYVILRENGKLYCHWDDEGSLIF